MPKKKFILKAVAGSRMESAEANKANPNRPFEGNLLNLAGLGVRWNTSMIRSMRAIGANEDKFNNLNAQINQTTSGEDYFYDQYNLVGQDDYIALFDQSYVARRDFLRKFALQGEIDYVLEAIANEVIVMDNMNYFAYPDTKRLKSRLKADENAVNIINDLNAAFRRVYHAWHFNEGTNAWQWVKKFLVDGFLCFEILYKTNQSTGDAMVITGFQEIDPTTIKPTIKYDTNGNEYKVWVQYEGDEERQREILDTNIIYISWAKNNFLSRLSYVEKLVRPFNMLRTIENSHLIWNIQNAQKRLNISIPGGVGSEQRNRSRIDEIKAYFKEDINIDEESGMLLVNGQPKFQFYKTWFTPVKNGEKIEINEIDHAGQDMSIEYLKYFWQRFIIETELPKDRFSMLLGDGSNPAPFLQDPSQMSKEEYKFTLFVKRIRGIIQELIIKPTWIQFCLKYPNFSTNDILRSSFGLKFIEEGVFERERDRKMMESAANTINSLAQLKQADGQTSVFATRFLLERFIGMSEDEWKVNEKYLAEEKQKLKEAQQNQQQAGAAPGGFGGGNDFGGGFGGGNDFGGGFGSGNDFGGGFGSGNDFGGGNDLGGAPGNDLGGGAPGGDFGGDLGGGADLGGTAPDAGGAGGDFGGGL